MEQIHRAAPEVPIAFVLPEEAQPLAQPYLRQPGVYHVAGQQGALALRAGDGGDTAAVARSTGLLWYSVMVFVALLLVGGVAALIAGRQSDHKAGGAA
jgi:hypothetical protein